MNRRNMLSAMVGGVITSSIQHAVYDTTADENEPGYSPDLHHCIAREWDFYLDNFRLEKDVYVRGFDTKAGYIDAYVSDWMKVERHYGRVKVVLKPDSTSPFYPEGAIFGS